MAGIAWPGSRRDRRWPSRGGAAAPGAERVEEPRRPCDNLAAHVCPRPPLRPGAGLQRGRHRAHAARAGARGADPEGDHRRRRLLDRRHARRCSRSIAPRRPTRPTTAWSCSRHERNQGKGAAVRTAVGAHDGRHRDHPGRRPRVRPARVPAADPADPRRARRRRLRLALPRAARGACCSSGTRSANRFLTLLSNMCTNLNLTDMETCYKVFRADILQRIPIRSEPLRPRARADGQGRAPALPHLRGADLLPRPAVLRGQEDRLEGRASRRSGRSSASACVAGRRARGRRLHDAAPRRGAAALQRASSGT